MDLPLITDLLLKVSFNWKKLSEDSSGESLHTKQSALTNFSTREASSWVENTPQNLTIF
jgi:hypothetical protein